MLLHEVGREKEALEQLRGLIATARRRGVAGDAERARLLRDFSRLLLRTGKGASATPFLEELHEMGEAAPDASTSASQLLDAVVHADSTWLRLDTGAPPDGAMSDL